VYLCVQNLFTEPSLPLLEFHAASGMSHLVKVHEYKYQLVPETSIIIPVYVQVS